MAGRSYAYNTRKKSPEQLEEELVGSERWNTLDDLLRELTLKKGEHPKQHWMIVGPRGIGKSHLLTLLYHKISNNPKLTQKWITVLFPEELRMAKDLAKFLERTVNEVLLEFEKEKSPFAEELQQEIRKIKEIKSSERIEYLFSILNWINQSSGKFILLIIENLQQLLGKKISIIEQKKLRAFLQTHDNVLLVGSATTVFNALHNHNHPFYNFFHIRRLNDLKFEEMKTLVVKILTDDNRPDIAKKVSENEARMKAIYSFTGGNPRMAVFLSNILKTEVPDEMIDFMDEILDDLTPYFESILNDTPDHMEEIMNTLATYEPAQSPKEIAEHLEMAQSTIRNYLKQMKENGYVRIAFSKGRSTYYCLNEYLYRIWYQMRDSSHREETRWLMELLMILYTPKAIMAEKSNIAKCSEEETIANSYKKLVFATADFIDRHPNYCKVIEWCVDSALINEIENEKTKDKSERVLFKKAKKLRTNEQYDEAITIYSTILQHNKYSEDAYLAWGYCLINIGKYEEAIEKFKKTLKINPGSENAYWYWGSSLEHLGCYEEAIDKFKKLLEINPKSEDAYWGWGDNLRELHQYKEAIAKFKKAIEIKHDFFAAYGSWGDCLSHLKQYKDAEEKYAKAIEINPQYLDAYSAWSSSLIIQKRYKEAIDICKALLKIDPKSEDAYEVWGYCLNSQHQYNEAIEKLQKVLEINPKSEDAYWRWGDSLRGLRQYKESIAKFKKAIEIKHDFFAAYGAWGDCLSHLKQYKDAEEKYAKAIEINPEYTDAYIAWGYCLRDQQHYDEAIVKFKKVLEINPNSEIAYGSWGECLMVQDHYNEAIVKFKKVLEINPDSEKAYGAWGECLREQAHYDEAIVKFKKVLEINPDSEKCYQSWACTLIDMKQYREAAEIFRQYLSNSQDCSIIYAYGNVLEEIDRHSEAITQFEKLINIHYDCSTVYLSYGIALEKAGNKENALLAYLKYIQYTSFDSLFHFQEIYTKHITPTLQTLKSEDYIKQLHDLEAVEFSKPQLYTFLNLLDKHELICEHFKDIAYEYREQEGKERADFDVMIFTIKLSIWLKLIDGNIYKALQLVELYATYINSIKHIKYKEEIVSELVLSLFKLQVHMNVKNENIYEALEHLKDTDVPFSDLFFKVWTCLSNPDSIDAQKHLSDKAISELIKQVKRKDESSDSGCSIK